MRLRVLAGLTLAGLALAAGPTALAGPARPTRPSAADARFQALYKTEWAWRENEFPGRDRADAPIADRLPRMDAADQSRRLAYWQDVRRRLDGIAERDLSPEEAINYQVYRDQLDTLIAQQKFREYEKPFNSDSSFWSD